MPNTSTTALQDALIRAISETARPLVRRMLTLGVPFGWVERALRSLFVEVAAAEFALPGYRLTDSRIALLTGINRKEVRRIRSARTRQSTTGTFGLNHMTSLVGRWTTDPRLSDGGRPRPRPYRAARGPSFVGLARQVTADLAPGVLLEQLVSSGAGEVRDGNVVALRESAFVPRRGSPEMLTILAEDPGELIETILHNALSREERRLQRKVYFDNVGTEAAVRLRKAVRREGERFLGRMDRLLAKYDRDRNPRAPGGERLYAGVGVYFFENAAGDRRAPGAKPTQRRTRPARRKEHER
ncbi:MAG TPA: DUF6502 family protein [Candidatus Binatia bacterium]